MYGLYRRQQKNRGLEFSIVKVSHLFGKYKGWIPWLLTEIYKDVSEPLKWHLPIGELVEEYEPGCSLLINLKPNAQDLHMYEVIHAWGHSSQNWTPVLLGLCPLQTNLKPAQRDASNFRCKRSTELCFSPSYLNGTLKQGKLDGTWSPPRPSSTNSVLIWPETFEFFATEAKKYFDQVPYSSSHL